MDRPLTSGRQEGKQKSHLQRDMCLALVSHELRTPTNAILCWARLIRDGYADKSTLAHGIDVIERKQTNVLNERIAEFLADGKVDQEEMPAYSELTRRLGLEYNGMLIMEDPTSEQIAH